LSTFCSALSTANSPAHKPAVKTAFFAADLPAFTAADQSTQFSS
jgi:hypothetical protein